MAEGWKKPSTSPEKRKFTGGFGAKLKAMTQKILSGQMSVPEQRGTGILFVVVANRRWSCDTKKTQVRLVDIFVFRKINVEPQSGTYPKPHLNRSKLVISGIVSHDVMCVPPFYNGVAYLRCNVVWLMNKPPMCHRGVGVGMGWGGGGRFPIAFHCYDTGKVRAN